MTPRFDVDTATPHEMALFLAGMGIPVAPFAWAKGRNSLGDIGCSCGRNRPPTNKDEPALCTSQGKHPTISGGVYAASSDRQQIDEWWDEWPEANLGMPAGEMSGILVVDLDPRNGAPSDRDGFQSKYGLIPDGTPEIISGSGGLHLWFAYDPERFREEVSRKLRFPPGPEISGDLELGPGIEIIYKKYAVVPPSMHRSGRRYRFDGENPLGSLPVLPSTPDWLYERIHRAVKKPLPFTVNGNGNGNGNGEQKWTKGTRTPGLASTAGALRHRGMDAEEIEATLLLINDLKCDPPLSAKDVKHVAKSYGSYPPGKAITSCNGVNGNSAGPPPVAETTFSLTDTGNCLRFINQHNGNVKFCHELGKFGEWLLWAGEWTGEESGETFTGGRWKLDGQKGAVELAKDMALAMKADSDRMFEQTKPDVDRLKTDCASANKTDRADIEKQIDKVVKDAKELLAWQKKSEQRKNIFDMLKLAESDPRVRIKLADLDKDQLLFNVPNGTLDMRTCQLREHRREDLITQMSPVPYDPNAKCPQWEKFLGEVFEGHEDLIPFIQTYVGYCLTGLTKEEYLVVFYGEGRNGKGTFLKILSELLGDYGTTADFNTFVDKGENTRGPRDDVANMKGKRFVASQETREGAKLAEALVKWLTGGDKVRARRFWENSDEFEPTWKILIATNHKPEISGDDAGIWSRIKLIPFTVSFEGREDKDLKKNLMAELPGILRWAVDGFKTYMRDGLVFPQSVADATAEYKKESDLLGQWLEECCVVADGLQSPAFKLHANYELWCQKTHEKNILNKNKFGRRLGKRKEVTTEHGRAGTVYVGIGIKPEGRDPYED